jgi:hypothetical protein
VSRRHQNEEVPQNARRTAARTSHALDQWWVDRRHPISPAEDANLRLGTTLTGQGDDVGAATITQHLARNPRLTKVRAVSTIWRILTRRGFTTAQPQKRPRCRGIRFTAEGRNELWQLRAGAHRLSAPHQHGHRVRSYCVRGVAMSEDGAACGSPTALTTQPCTAHDISSGPRRARTSKPQQRAETAAIAEPNATCDIRVTITRAAGITDRPASRRKTPAQPPFSAPEGMRGHRHRTCVSQLAP